MRRWASVALALAAAWAFGAPSVAQPPEEGRTVESGVADAGRPGDPATSIDAGRIEGPAGEVVDAGTAPPSSAVSVDAGGLDGAVALDAASPDGSIATDAGDPDAGVDALDAPEEEESLVEAATSAAVEISREPTTAQVIRTILGLMLLLALAWLGGLPRVRRLEERLGISQVVTSGLPFVGLGLVMHLPGIDVLNEDVLRSLTPLLQFGLGWIGFHTGFQFEGRAMDEVPRGTGSVVVMLTSMPFALIAGLAALVMFATGLWDPTHDDATWGRLARDACLLGLAGALSSPLAGSLVKGQNGRAQQLSATVAVLDDVFGVFALALLSAWLRPSHADGWQLPGVGWLFITLGMAATLGLVVHFSLLTAESVGERTALLLGSVAFTAGLAGYASISPLVVCFLAGLVLRNVPGGDKASFEAAFTRLERPVYLLFLTIVGALWQIDDWRGWVMFLVFVGARLTGRYLGARSARRLPDGNRPASLSSTPDHELVLAPMGQLAIAFVVAAQTLYESPAIRATVTAVIGGSIVSEVLARIAVRKSAQQATAPQDESPIEPSASDATIAEPATVAPIPADAPEGEG